jgi:hypothetical protein
MALAPLSNKRKIFIPIKGLLIGRRGRHIKSVAGCSMRSLSA